MTAGALDLAERRDRHGATVVHFDFPGGLDAGIGEDQAILWFAADGRPVGLKARRSFFRKVNGVRVCPRNGVSLRGVQSQSWRTIDRLEVKLVGGDHG